MLHLPQDERPAPRPEQQLGRRARVQLLAVRVGQVIGQQVVAHQAQPAAAQLLLLLRLRKDVCGMRVERQGGSGVTER